MSYPNYFTNDNGVMKTNIIFNKEMFMCTNCFMVPMCVYIDMLSFR